MAWSDLSGQTVGRYFVRDKKIIALKENGYKQLRRLVEGVLRIKPFINGFSSQFLEEEVFTWWRSTVRGDTEIDLSTHLLDAAEAAMSRHTILIPLGNIEIESAFLFGDARITPMHLLPFDRFGDSAIDNFPERRQDIINKRERLKIEFSHLTGVQIEVIGDPQYAREQAHAAAFDIADILRLMSPAALTHNVTFLCLPHGCDHVPSTTNIEIRDGGLGSISTGILNPGLFQWRVTMRELDELMTAGFQQCAVFFSGRELTDFEKRVKTSISSYSRGVATYDRRDRLVYSMSAAEHLLLRDSNEPIQSSVGDRIAFMIANDTQSRQQVVANFKRAYNYRSRQVHHLSSVDDDETLSTFFHNMWVMLLSAISNMHKFENHQDFLSALDKMKYS